MPNVFAINGSPNQARGNTAMILEPFIDGLIENNAAVDLFYASRLKVQPCACGNLICWRQSPGECFFQDTMQTVYPVLREADFLVLATPIYIPLPGDMQNFLNRLCPLIDPVLTFREGRTRARFRADVHIKTVVLLAVGGWLEKENFNTLIRIVEELAEDASVNFAGAMIRPHAHLMRKNGQITDQGKEVLQAIKGAAGELIREGRIHAETLATIRQPLIPFEEAREIYFNR
jgi:multimeric flavodoxin WrbA